jgi:hypothetical protein
MPPATPGNQHNAHSPTAPDGEPRSRRRRSSRKKGPKPWFVLKLSVGLAAGIIGYSSYVYIGRLCIPMIRRERDSLGSRTLGSECCPSRPNHPSPPFESSADHLVFCFLFFLAVVFLGVFVVLGMMMIWAYIKVRCWPGSVFTRVIRLSLYLSPYTQDVFFYHRSCSLHQDMLSR